MNCKNLKIRTKKYQKYLYCEIQNKTITWDDCKGCVLKKYKLNNINKKYVSKRNPKITKLERNRFSLVTDDLKYCIICGQKKDNLHEVFFGTSRLNSMRYGCVIPLCVNHHQEIHKNGQLQDYWHKKMQEEFIKAYPNLDFVDIFKQNYFYRKQK